MQRLILFIAILLCLLIQALPAQSGEQTPGTELKFENVDEIRKRPSDIHIGSDPEYRPGMETEYEGNDEAGYEKGAVGEEDKEYREVNTYFKTPNEEQKSTPPTKRWE